jgi:hypothetical protein
LFRCWHIQCRNNGILHANDLIANARTLAENGPEDKFQTSLRAKLWREKIGTVVPPPR